MKILIVDDEPLARERLRDLILDIDRDHRIMEAENGMVALKIVEQNPPDVILLDIRMPVMDGMETAMHLSKSDTPPAIIFATAYQDHAIEAFEVHAVDYLLKPIRRGRLEKALERVNTLKKTTLSALIEAVEQPASRNFLSASSYGKIELVPVEEIRYLKAEQKYVVAGWSGKETLIDESLKTLENEFPKQFQRIHRNALVSPEYITALEKQNDGSFNLFLRDVKDGLPVSRRHLQEVRRTLKKLGLS